MTEGGIWRDFDFTGCIHEPGIDSQDMPRITIMTAKPRNVIRLDTYGFRLRHLLQEHDTRYKKEQRASFEFYPILFIIERLRVLMGNEGSCGGRGRGLQRSFQSSCNAPHSKTNSLYDPLRGVRVGMVGSGFMQASFPSVVH
jgi:hypothetical protein